MLFYRIGPLKLAELKQNSFYIATLITTEKAKLQQLMQHPNDFLINEKEFKSLNFNELNTPSVISNNPLLLMAKQQLAVMEMEKNVIKADALPDFKVGYFIQSIAGVQDVNGQIKTYTSIPQFQGIQLGINVPIFGKNAYKAKNEAINTQILAQQKQNEQVQTQLESQLKQVIEQYNYWKNNVAYYENTALMNVQLMINNATKSYKNGEINYIEYGQVLQTNLDAQKAYLGAINNVNKAVLALQFIVNQ